MREEKTNYKASLGYKFLCLKLKGSPYIYRPRRESISTTYGCLKADPMGLPFAPYTRARVCEECMLIEHTRRAHNGDIVV